MTVNFHRRRAVGLAVVLCGLAMLSPGESRGQGAKKSDAYVKVTAKADKPDADGNQAVTLLLMIDKGWHAYANPVGLDDLADAATTVKAAGKTQLVKVEYPPGTLHKDKVVGDYKVYEGAVPIKATIRRAANGADAELQVKLQVCNEKMCLPPGTIKVRLP